LLRRWRGYQAGQRFEDRQRFVKPARPAVDFDLSFLIIPYIKQVVRQIEHEERRLGGPAPNLAGSTLEADTPSSLVVRFGLDRPLHMEAGVDLSPLTVAYQTYGTLNAAKSNAVLVCHALTGDQHVASRNPVTGKNGWWETMIGPGKPIDTDRFFVICANVVGGCMGTTGPASTNPATG
jgi:hypothetical protein